MKVNKSYEQSNNTGINILIPTNKNEFLCLLSVRLREERLAKTKRQSEVAELCGVTVRTWGKYENAETLPDAFILFELFKLGFDVHYILTGERTPIIASTEEEQKIISQYRKANEPIKFAIRNIFEAVGL